MRVNSSLGDILGAALRQQQSSTASILPEAAIERLREAAERRARTVSGPCPYAVGDLVTPRADAPISHRGTPMLVSESYLVGREMTQGGEPIDMVLLRIDGDGDIMPLNAPSWMFEPWTQAIHDEASAASRSSASETRSAH